ncbi:MAG: hypothetical protein ACSHX6_05480 [Akkermansiaceae bacterium]
MLFTKGTSDKVYEVDLCQSADDEYVVNFRFGKAGSRLREGTKTAFPVDLAVAEIMFTRLVKQKTDKGYLDNSTSHTHPPSTDSTTAPEPSPEPDEADTCLATPEQKAAILTRLAKWTPQVSKTNWSLSRVIWRAGQLQIKSALPLIAKHITTKLTQIEKYSIAWTIARIGDKSTTSTTSTTILDALEKITDEKPVKRMIREARILCLPKPDALTFLDQQKEKLSQDTKEKLTSDQFSEYLKSPTFYKDASAPVNMEILYSISLLDSSISPHLIDFAAQVKIDEGTFRLLRLLYKLSEVRHDGMMLGTLVNRLEVEACRSSERWEFIGNTQQLVRKGVFSSNTKRYFKKRSVSSLTKMGQDKDIASYITQATGILASASEALPTHLLQQTTAYSYNQKTRRFQQYQKHAPRYGNLHCLTWILRGNSPRLQFSPKSLHWSYLEGTSPNDDIKELREEPYQEFWDQAPDAIIHLLSHAKLNEVHRFANAVWLANPNFVNEVQATDIVHFISSFYDDTKRLGLELVDKFWNPKQPNYKLLEALILSNLDEAHTIGFTYLPQAIDATLTQPQFLAKIFTSPQIAIHERLRGLYIRKNIPNIFTEIASLFPTNSTPTRSAQLAIQTLALLNYKHTADLVEQSELNRLLASQDEESQWYALHCYRHYAQTGKVVPEQIIINAIESEHASIRAQGVSLLEAFSDEQLIEQSDLIASCCASKSAELRQGILPILKRLVAAQPSFGREMVESLYPFVVRKEASEGIHDDVLAILLGPLRSSLTAIPEDTFRRMLKSKYAAAHVLGLHLLERETKLDDEPLLQVLEWANHPHQALRKQIISHLHKNPERLMMQLSETRQLVESEWDDVRDFGMDFLRNRVPEERWTVEALVDLCDSVKPRVQDFGREMITKRFREQDGEIYLTKLSQHPTREMQQFATHFLKQTASDQPEIILNLEFYFRTVMGAVSSGRVAKDRVSMFLKQEAEKNQDVAVMAIQLWHDHAATCAIGDKATCLEAILNTQRTWPELNLNFYSDLKLIDLETREVRS